MWWECWKTELDIYLSANVIVIVIAIIVVMIRYFVF